MNKLSIVIPVYNSEKYISKCLDSILQQTYSDFNVIIVNDGSTDKSECLVNEYISKDSRIKLINQKNQGVSAARLTGVKNASGDYISLIDSDDYLENDYLEKMMNPIKKFGVDISISGHIRECDHKTELRLNKISSGLYDNESIVNEVLDKMMCWTDGSFWGIQQYLWNKIFKRDLLLNELENIDNNIYDGEDVAIVFPAISKAQKIYIADICGYHYVIHDNSAINTKRNEKYFVNAVYLFDYLKNEFGKSEYKELLMPQLMEFIRYFMDNGTRSIFGYGFDRGCVQLQSWAVPLLPVNTKIVIYGAGKIGEEYYSRLIQNSNYEIVSWVDENKYGEKIFGRLIDDPFVILNLKFDYVIIAIKNHKVRYDVATWLRNNGIDADKICEETPVKEKTGYQFKVL